MIDAAIKTLLRNNVTISAACGSRVYPVLPPQDSDLPCMSWSRISTDRGLHHGGATKRPTALFQVTVFAETSTQAKELAAAVVAQFHGYKGTSSGEVIHLAEVENEVDFADTGIYQVAIDVRITHNE